MADLVDWRGNSRHWTSIACDMMEGKIRWINRYRWFNGIYENGMMDMVGARGNCRREEVDEAIDDRNEGVRLRCKWLSTTE